MNVNETKESKYAVVMNSLIERINKEEFSSDYMLPPESALIQEYGVSRITIRKALESMEAQGYIFRKQGKGTFINRSRADEQKFKKYSGGLTSMISKTGRSCRRIQLEKAIVPAGEAGKEIQLQPEDDCLLYRRIYTADDVPVYYVESTINHQFCPSIELYDFSFISISMIIQNILEAKLYRHNRKVETVRAGEEVAKYLNLHSDDPVLLLTYSSYLSDGNRMIPFEKVVLYARTDVVPLDPDFF